MAMESVSHQQFSQLDAKITKNVNEVIQTQLQKIVATEMKNIVLPR